MTRRTRNSRILLPWVALAAALVLTLPAAAQWETNSSINNFVSNHPAWERPEVVFDGIDGVYVLWSGNGEVRLQHLDDQANKWSNDVVIGNGSEGVMVSDGANGVIVAWRRAGGGSSGDDIFAQRVDINGTIQWASTGHPMGLAAGTQSTPSIVAENGGALISWTDARFGTKAIYAQKVDGAGAPLWGGASGKKVSPQTLTGNQIRSSIAPDGSGGAFVAWQDQRSGWDVYAQRVDGSGNALWSTDRDIAVFSQTQSFPQVVTDQNGGAIILWYDARNGLSEVFAQRVDGMGSKLWTAAGEKIATSVVFPNNLRGYEVVSDGANGALVAWGTGGAVKTQRLLDDATRVWGTGGLTLDTAAYPDGVFSPDVVATNSQDAIVVWHGFHKVSGEGDVLAQFVNSAGNPAWGPGGLMVSDADDLQQLPAIDTDDICPSYIGWVDHRGTQQGSGVYAQRIRCFGILGRIALSPHEAVAYLHEDAIQKVDVAVGDPVVVEWVNVEVAYDPDILGPGEVSFEGTVLGEMAVSVDSSQEGVLRIQAEGSVLLEGTLPFLNLIFQPVAVGSAIPTFTHFEVNGGEVSTDARAARITVEP